MVGARRATGMKKSECNVMPCGVPLWPDKKADHLLFVAMESPQIVRASYSQRNILLWSVHLNASETHLRWGIWR